MYIDPELCPLMVWDTNEFDEHPIGHCRCDGKYCVVQGEWDKCRLNFPPLPKEKI